jgi:Flp pilus assembly protein TadG
MRIHGMRLRRRAAAAAELALLLPTIVLLFVIAFDFCRVFHYYSVLTNCARAGAVYASDPYAAAPIYGSVSEAALADWPSSLGSAPNVSATAVSDGGHNYMDVQVTYTFQTVVSYVGVPATVNLSRTVRVRVAQQIPNF